MLDVRRLPQISVTFASEKAQLRRSNRRRHVVTVPSKHIPLIFRPPFFLACDGADTLPFRLAGPSRLAVDRCCLFR